VFLIDTSVWIFALKKQFHPYIKERVERVLTESDVAINGIIELELLCGTKTDKEYSRLKSRLDGLYYIESNRSLWDNASRLAFELKHRGINIPQTDVMIAASAIDEGAVLIHADIHFDMIAGRAGLNLGLKVESLVSHVR
jgi:predicted nucleic acid-binding protein